jgi:hypothetical protein
LRTLTRRGFITAAAATPFAPEPAPRVLNMEEMVAAYDETMGIGRLTPLREVTVYKGASVGYTTAVLENVIGYDINAFGARQLPAFPNAAEKASWGWVDSDIKSDLRNALRYLEKHRRFGSSK